MPSAYNYSAEKNGENKKDENTHKPATNDKGSEASGRHRSPSMPPNGKLTYPQLASHGSQESTIVVATPGTATPITTSRKRSAYTNPPSAIGGVRLADNPQHDLKNLAEVGKPDDTKMRFKLKVANGGYTKAFRFEGRKEPKWDDKDWVAELNKWRTKTLKRYFASEDATPSNKSGPRVRWSYAELEYLRLQIRKRVRSTGAPLSGKDWKKLTELQNERFQGKKIRVGEKLAGGKIAVTDQTIQKRSQAAITAWYGKYDDLREIVEEEMMAFSTEVSDENSESGDFSSDLDNSDGSSDSDEEEGGAKDHNLEDSSDGEDEGRRPAGQPVGGVLIDAAS